MPEGMSVYLHRDPVDFRKSIDGLGAIVQEELKLDVFSPNLFVFCCARRKRLKILYWDKTGFALWYKRLEADRFPWPRSEHPGVVELTHEQLGWLLDGIDIWTIKPHKARSYEKMC
jgi:transposase